MMRADFSAYRRRKPRTSSVERSLILKSMPGFADLSGAELALLASFARERRFSPGDVLLTPGQPVQKFFLIVDGEVEMFLGGQSVGRFSSRTSVGGLASLARDPRGAHAIARSPVLALEMDAEEMEEFFEDNSNLIIGVLGALARGVRELQEERGGPAIDGPEYPDYPVTSGLTLVDKMFLMRTTSNFREVSIEALAELAEGAHEAHFRAGATLWRRGDLADHYYMIVAGTLVATSPGAPPRTFTSRWLVGGLDNMGRLPRWYDLRAETDTVALRLRSTVLYDVLEDYPDMGLRMLRALSRGALALQERKLTDGTARD
ncbi:MAG: cyclic nucleotide-binding domain-containing protein [Myxococcota bacterium]